MSQRPNRRSEPERLIAEGGRPGWLLEQANRQFEATPDEAAAFRRVSARLTDDRPQRAPRGLVLAAFALTTSMAALALALWLRTPPDRAHPSTSPATAKPSASVERRTSSAPSAAIDLVRPEATFAALRSGRQRLPDGTEVELKRGGSARLRADERTTEVTLEQGRIELSVTKQPPGRTIEVASGAYRFRVIGTVFSVSASANALALEVREGRVAVWHRERVVAKISAGEDWSAPSTAAPEAASSASSAAIPAEQAAEVGPSETLPRASNLDCMGLARSGNARDAENCFVKRLASGGLGAEMALYEIARLRRDVLGNPSGALQALADYRARFPNGSLRREVDVSYVELLARLGRTQDALRESAQLLSSAAGRERPGELHVLRGNLYRKALRDLDSAQAEYAKAARYGGAVGAEATYLRAVCLEQLGNRAEAILAYQQYLAKPGRPHQAKVQRRLAELSR